MNNKLRLLNSEIRKTKHWVLLLFCALFSIGSFSQVKSSTDVKSIKIGEEITYKIEVETDTTNYVVFPEGQTFQPLEMIESYKTDTVKKNAKYQLIKTYGLTQFDSGRYVIPKQKVIIANKTVELDSILVEINPIVVDTTKQNLYDIKPLIKVEAPSSNWWLYVVLAIIHKYVLAIYFKVTKSLIYFELLFYRYERCDKQMQKYSHKQYPVIYHSPLFEL